MGAFLLYKKNTNIDKKSATEIFVRKSFDAPQEVELGEWVLWHYKKQLLDVVNASHLENSFSVYAVGTPVYKGKTYSDGLRQVLIDYAKGEIDQSLLVGSFCLIFWDGKKISFLTDRQQTYHVFYNEEHSVVSSSFLAVVAASTYPRALNKLALYEKLSTGYIVRPDTLVSGIYQFDRSCRTRFNVEKDKLEWLDLLPVGEIELHGKGFESSLDCQSAQLEHHFKLLDNCCTEFGAELGLSDGFDSRLVLASTKYLKKPIVAHTHATKNAHDTTRPIVKKLVDLRGIPLVEVETSRIEKHSAQSIEQIMMDGLYYYDGRCSDNMGAFSETYTAAYRKKLIQSNYFSLNGLGGELYRNYYGTSSNAISLRDWMLNGIYYYFAIDAMGNKELFETMHQNKLAKIFARIGPAIGTRASFLWRRRYYSEVRMPDCDANNNDAHNQLAFFHTPFMDADIVQEGLKATPYIGTGDSYEAALICKIDDKLGSIMSHYGYSMSHIPDSVKLKMWLKSKIPSYLLYIRNKSKNRRLASKSILEFINFVNNTKCLYEIKNLLLESRVLINFEEAMLNYAQRPTTFSVGMFLKSFHGKIKWE